LPEIWAHAQGGLALSRALSVIGGVSQEQGFKKVLNDLMDNITKA